MTHLRRMSGAAPCPRVVLAFQRSAWARRCTRASWQLRSTWIRAFAHPTPRLTLDDGRGGDHGRQGQSDIGVADDERDGVHGHADRHLPQSRVRPGFPAPMGEGLFRRLADRGLDRLPRHAAGAPAHRADHHRARRSNADALRARSRSPDRRRRAHAARRGRSLRARRLRRARRRSAPLPRSTSRRRGGAPSGRSSCACRCAGFPSASRTSSTPRSFRPPTARRSMPATGRRRTRRW